MRLKHVMKTCNNKCMHIHANMCTILFDIYKRFEKKQQETDPWDMPECEDSTNTHTHTHNYT
jgi:hypothetical protein